MKIQDLTFFIVLFFSLVFIKSSRFFVIMGLLCLIFAFFAFKFWILFTAERLTWYAAAFILTGIILFSIKELKS